MMMNNKFAGIVAVAFGAMASLVAAAPLDVWDPPIISPNKNTVWKIGEVTNVTW